MKSFCQLVCLLFTVLSCKGQSDQENMAKLVGGPCEGCEAVYEYGGKLLTSVDTLPDYRENEPKLKINGRVFNKDGKTPASNVILYIYHTNRDGIYPTRGNETGWARRHGFIRGWVKTGEDGQYTFYSFRPAAYPNRTESEHIHIIVKEPDKNEYYIDSFEFADDPLLTSDRIDKKKMRGGSGVVQPEQMGNIYLVERDIVLGLNIPDYH